MFRHDDFQLAPVSRGIGVRVNGDDCTALQLDEQYLLESTARRDIENIKEARQSMAPEQAIPNRLRNALTILIMLGVAYEDLHLLQKPFERVFIFLRMLQMLQVVTQLPS